MTNAELIQAASAGVSELARLEEQYRAAKVILADGAEIEIPAGYVTALKAKFATVRTAVKGYLDAVTP
jgi:hypothetical protein